MFLFVKFFKQLSAKVYILFCDFLTAKDKKENNFMLKVSKIVMNS